LRPSSRSGIRPFKGGEATGGVEDKVAIVTGAASGIGRATAIALAHEGARVALADIDENGGASVSALVDAAGGVGLFRRTDVASTRDVAALVASTVRRFGRLDILVNNAGVAVEGSVTDISEQDWNRVLDVNLTSMWRGMHFAIPEMLKTGDVLESGPEDWDEVMAVDGRGMFLSCKYAIEEMLKTGGGSIVNTSSVQASIGFVGWAGYAASKGGIDALTRQVAVEYASQNIRVNAVVPGTILTPMNERIVRESPDGAEIEAGWLAMHPVRRLGRPEEVAAAIVWLSSDDSSFVTGECLRVDGGMIVKAG
jgi:NAD(P)-dependent dehydrogenase (short-subunit alcohol dehydrogenase family)